MSNEQLPTNSATPPATSPDKSTIYSLSLPTSNELTRPSSPNLPGWDPNSLTAIRRTNDLQPILMAVFQYVLENVQRTQCLLVNNIQELIAVTPKLAKQLNDLSNTLMNQWFTLREMEAILDRASHMTWTNRYFVTLAIVNCY
jgi:hypothetical protein